MSWTWVGSFRIREYLENPAQAWPPEFNAVYVVSEDDWTAGNGPNAAFYVGTSFTRRFRARIGDLIADMLGLDRPTLQPTTVADSKFGSTGTQNAGGIR